MEARPCSIERELFVTKTVDLDEAQEKLQDLLAQALAGNEVVITDHGKPVARLVPVPVAPPRKKRVAGLNRGTISTSEDFDQPLPDEFWLGQE
jgi:prevent-host-death family protein